MRGVDTLIWALIWINVVGLGPFAGVLAIATSDFGALGKLFAEIIESADTKQPEGRAGGRRQALAEVRFGLMPQVLPVIAGQILYFIESNTRSATIIGVVGAGGIGLLSVRADPRAGMAAGLVPHPDDPDLGRRDRLHFRQAARRHGRPSCGARLTGQGRTSSIAEQRGDMLEDQFRPRTTIAARRRAMGLLARALASELAEPLKQRFADHGAKDLKPAETGLVMLRGRAGGDGAPFNLGEATVTRAVVELAGGERGYAPCSGPRRRAGAAGARSSTRCGKSRISAGWWRPRARADRRAARGRARKDER